MNSKTVDLGSLQPAKGAVKKTKRIGRGRGSGHGDTATKGNKGAQSRSGYTYRPAFEGGQMPIQRRLPKRGFNVPDRTEYIEVTLAQLPKVGETEISPATLRAAGIVRGRGPIVLLGGDAESIKQAYQVAVHRATGTAKAAIEAAGGSIEIIPLDPEDRRVKKGPAPKKSGTAAA